MASNASNASASSPHKRWTHFYSALQLAIQRAAHKWTYQEFSECFPLWCEEQPSGAETVFRTVSSFVEKYNIDESNKLFEQYDVQPNIDRLHAVVQDARLRRDRGDPPPPDAWRADLDPRTAVRARTVPVLEAERDRLRAQLAAMEDRNRELQEVIQSNVKAKKVADAKAEEIFAFLDDLLAKWKELPLEEMQSWTLQTAEAQAAVHPAT